MAETVSFVFNFQPDDFKQNFLVIASYVPPIMPLFTVPDRRRSPTFVILHCLDRCRQVKFFVASNNLPILVFFSALEPQEGGGVPHPAANLPHGTHQSPLRRHKFPKLRGWRFVLFARLARGHGLGLCSLTEYHDGFVGNRSVADNASYGGTCH